MDKHINVLSPKDEQIKDVNDVKKVKFKEVSPYDIHVNSSSKSVKDK